MIGGPLRRFGAASLASVVAASVGWGIVSATPESARQIVMGDASVWLVASELGAVVLLDGADPGSSPVVTEQLGSPGDRLVVHQHNADAIVVDQTTGGVSRVSAALRRTSDPISYFESDSSVSVDVAIEDEVGWAFEVGGTKAMRIDPSSLMPAGDAVVTKAAIRSAVIGPDGSLLLSVGDDGVINRVPVDDASKNVTEWSSSGVSRPELVRVGGQVVAIDASAASFAIVGEKGLGSPVVCPGGAERVLVVGSGDASSALATLVSADGVVVAFDPATGECRASDAVGVPGTELGSPVETGGYVFVPDLTAGSVVVLDAGTMELVTTTALVGVAAGFELVTHSGVVFYNDPSSPAAGVVFPGAVPTAQPKYASGSGIEVLGQSTDAPEPEAPPEIGEWACRADSVQQVVGVDVVFSVSGPGAVDSAVWRVEGEEIGALPLTYSFAEPGSKQVAVEIQTVDGATVPVECSIDIVESTTALALIANFGWSPSTVFVGQEVAFVDTSDGGATERVWTFAGGTPPTATGRTPGVRFESVGDHVVTLVVSRPGDDSTLRRTVTVKAAPSEPPNVGIAVSALEVSANQNVLLQAEVVGGAPVDYRWEIATESEVVRRTGDSQSITWTTGGTYSVTLVATDGMGRSDTATVSVVVKAATEPNVRIDGPSTMETAGTAIFNGSVSIPEGDIRSWSWQSSEHEPRTGQRISLDSPGKDFTLTLTVSTVTGITRSTSKVIKVTDQSQYRSILAIFYGDASISYYPDGRGQTSWSWTLRGDAGDIPYTGSPTTSGCQPSRIDWQLRDAATSQILTSGTSSNSRPTISFQPSSAHTAGVRITATAVAKDSRCVIADFSELIPYVLPKAFLVISGPTTADVGTSFTVSVAADRQCAVQRVEWTIGPPGPGAPPFPSFERSITITMPDLSQELCAGGARLRLLVLGHRNQPRLPA